MAQAQQLYAQWFQLADEDKDGSVGGGEAVKFFLRSGLSQAVLGQVRGRSIPDAQRRWWVFGLTVAFHASLCFCRQIWELASGGGPKLNQFQFSSAMRLVALAQVHGKTHTAGIAGGRVPKPRLGTR